MKRTRNIHQKCFIVTLGNIHQKCFIAILGNLFENTYSRRSAGIHSVTSLVVSFSRIFSIRNTWVFFVLLFFFFAVMCHTLCFYLFLQKIRRPVIFSTSWLLLIVIDKFANRNSCGYCFRRFGKFPRERLQWSSQ